MRIQKHDEILDQLRRVQQAKYELDILLSQINNKVIFRANVIFGQLFNLHFIGNESVEVKSKSGDYSYEDITDGYEKGGNFSDMRTAFMAIGPAFKSNYANPLSLKMASLPVTL